MSVPFQKKIRVVKKHENGVDEKKDQQLHKALFDFHKSGDLINQVTKNQ